MTCSAPTFCLFILLISSTVFCIEKARFDFYRVYEITANNEDHLKIFQHILDYPDGYKFMSNPPMFIGANTQLIVPPHKFGEWSELVEKFSINLKLLSNNYQEDIDKEEMRYNRRKATVYDWTSFKTYNETYTWMSELANGSNEISTFTVGQTYEGRNIMGLRINVGNRSGKKSIVFEGNIHANEWIGCSTITYIINELLSSNDADVKEILKTFDWYFVPILNLDGYHYTWTVDRTWRKTRRPTKNPLCHGADPNRNWDIFWGSYGGSLNPCSTGYYGDHTFSELEIEQFADFLNKVPNFFGYISFHSYGRLLMTPYAYTHDSLEQLDVINEIGTKAVETIQQFRGSNYQLGKISDFFGLVAGSSVDYIIRNQKPYIPFCYELSYNHILPNEEIIETGREIFASIKTIFKEAITRGMAQ